jgi:hypothetical protein
VLERCSNNKRQACRELGISYHTLQNYLRLPSLSEGWFRNEHERTRIGCQKRRAIRTNQIRVNPCVSRGDIFRVFPGGTTIILRARASSREKRDSAANRS